MNSGFVLEVAEIMSNGQCWSLPKGGVAYCVNPTYGTEVLTGCPPCSFSTTFPEEGGKISKGVFVGAVGGPDFFANRVSWDISMKGS